MSDFTPTTAQVREAASLDGSVAVEPDAFERWLAARDRATAARAWHQAAAWIADPHDARSIRQANPYCEGDPT